MQVSKIFNYQCSIIKQYVQVCDARDDAIKNDSRAHKYF
jgi:hypothetical protein